MRALRRNGIEDVQLPADVLVMLDEAADAGVPVASLYGTALSPVPVTVHGTHFRAVPKTLDHHLARTRAWIDAYPGRGKKQKEIVAKISARLKAYADEARVTLEDLAEMLNLPSFEVTYSDERLWDEAARRWDATVRAEEDLAEEDDEDRDDEEDADREAAVQEAVQSEYYGNWANAVVRTAERIYEKYGLDVTEVRREADEPPYAVRIEAGDWLKPLGEMGADLEDTELDPEWEPNDQVAARDYVLKNLSEIWPRHESPKRIFEEML